MEFVESGENLLIGAQLPTYRMNSSTDALRKWRKIFLEKKPVKYPARTVIVGQDEVSNYVYYVISGLVEFTHTDLSGAERLIEIIGQNSIINLQPLVGKTAPRGSFIALEDCTVVLMNRKELYEHMAKDTQLAEELLEEMTRIVIGLTQQLFDHSVAANDRIEQAIYLLADNKRQHTQDGKDIFIGLSQSDFARIARTTRVTTTKIMSELKRKGLLETVYGGILVKDLPGLKALLDEREKRT